MNPMTDHNLLISSWASYADRGIWGWIDPARLGEGVQTTDNIILPVQTHSCNIKEVDETGTAIDGEGLEQTDAIITRKRGVTIGIRTADCVPILLFAPDIMAVAAIHAGWRGTLGRIAGLTAYRLIAMGADPARMRALIANCICHICYEIGDELASAFIDDPLLAQCISRSSFADPLGERSFDEHNPHLDLPLANKLILTWAGLGLENISTTGICTRHSALQLPSWRRDPGTSRRMITWIRLPDETTDETT